MKRGTPSAWASVLALALALAVPPGFAGDAAVAKTLFDGGQKALRARKYSEAAVLFGKAWVEDPTLTDAVYWKACAQDKGKDPDAALETFRRYLALLEKEGADRITSEKRKLRKGARDRIRALAVAEEEFDAAEEKYVAALLAIVRKRGENGESDAALKAAQRILEVDPDNEEALAVRRRLAPDADPYADVKEWRYPIREKAYRGPSCEYVGDNLVLDARSGGMLRPNPGIRMEGGFACETEFTVRDAYDPDWAVGLVFGDDGAHLWVLDARASRVELLWGEKGKAPQTVGSAALSTLDAGKPHRIGVLVREGVVLCRLDGEVVVRGSAEGMPTDGDLGIYMKHCRAELTLLRAGRLP
jgi:tetratricopeptide (TPR) repeat protein